MDLLDSFKQRAEDLAGSINRQGGLKATIDALRRQMAEADRRRALSRAKAEIKQLNRQITEMITAVGIQAVGLHKAGKLSSPELEPLCQHIVVLQSTVSQQEAELTRLEALAQANATRHRPCPQCGKPLPLHGAFCAFCGAPIVVPSATALPATAAAPAVATPTAPVAVPAPELIAGPTPGSALPAASVPKGAAPAQKTGLCPRCGTALRSQARFCPKCGQTTQG